MRRVAFVLLLLATSCGSAQQEATPAPEVAPTEGPTNLEADNMMSSQPASSEADNMMIPPPTSSMRAAPTFMGYPCIEDCSGHEAGYDWAEEQGITGPNDCDGNSDSFIEGCEAYAEEAALDEPYEADY